MATPSIIDSQVHAYERNRPERPWVGTLAGPEEVTGDDMVRAMDTVGVDGALLVSPWAMYRYDGSYAQAVQAQYPDRFAIIKPFDPDAPDVAEQIADWATQPGVVGARIMLGAPAADDANPHGLAAICAGGAQHGLPINVLCWGNLPRFEALVRAHANTQFVIDHLGTRQPFAPPAPSDPFRDLDAVLALARYDNVAIKVSGTCTLSHAPFPFADLEAPLARVFEAYGLERCLWGTDWTRATALVSFDDAVQAFRVMGNLSDSDRAMLMGGAVTRLYGWSPKAG